MLRLARPFSSSLLWWFPARLIPSAAGQLVDWMVVVEVVELVVGMSAEVGSVQARSEEAVLQVVLEQYEASHHP